MNNKYLFIIVPFGVLLVVCGLWWFFAKKKQPIKVGILYSSTGFVAVSELPLIDATVMAFEEINSRGGVLGRPIEWIIEDGQSNEAIFEQKAHKLVHEDKVAAIFGCWLSGSRKRVRPIVEQANNLLFFPVQTEGLEESPNIVYAGAAPNQSIIPAFAWCCYNLGKRVFLVGSNDVYTYSVHAMVKFQAETLGATIVGEEHIPLGNTDLTAIMTRIKEAQPNVIFSSIDGPTNKVFFKELRKAGLSGDKVPVMSLNITEAEIIEYGVDGMVGDYTIAHYFQAIDRAENKLFIERFKNKFGQDRVFTNSMESAYDTAFLWAQAVQQAKDTAVAKVLPYLKKQIFSGPGSITYVDDNLYLWWRIFIGKIRFDGQFDIVWESQKCMPPDPYPPYEDKKYWDTFLTSLYENWGEQWIQPLGSVTT